MAGQTSIEIHLPDEEATTGLGARLAPWLGPGDVLLLEGDLGSGKTHLARAIIQSRLEAAGRLVEDVPSPSFTLVQTYDLGDLEIWHTDLYRLSGPEDIHELGLEDAFETAIVLVEWPDRLGHLTPRGAITLALSAHRPNGRLARLSGWRDRGGLALG